MAMMEETQCTLQLLAQQVALDKYTYDTSTPQLPSSCPKALFIKLVLFQKNNHKNSIEGSHIIRSHWFYFESSWRKTPCQFSQGSLPHFLKSHTSCSFWYSAKSGSLTSFNHWGIFYWAEANRTLQTTVCSLLSHNCMSKQGSGHQKTVEVQPPNSHH